MDESSLQAGGAPRFVGDKLVDPLDFDPTGPQPKATQAVPNKHNPQGVYSLVSYGLFGALLLVTWVRLAQCQHT